MNNRELKSFVSEGIRGALPGAMIAWARSGNNVTATKRLDNSHLKVQIQLARRAGGSFSVSARILERHDRVVENFGVVAFITQDELTDEASGPARIRDILLDEVSSAVYRFTADVLRLNDLFR